MPTETLYQPPDGEGPSVVRETRMTCKECKHFHFAYCSHPNNGVTSKLRGVGQSAITPSWCPIVSASPEEWAKRMQNAD